MVHPFATNNTNRWYFANDGHIRPEANQTYDIGSTAQEVRNVYALNLNVQDNFWFTVLVLAVFNLGSGARDFLVND